jgi:hypothetical protein
MYTNTKKKDSDKYICPKCIKKSSITFDVARKKWKLPSGVLNTIECTIVRGAMCYSKEDIKRVALEYHKGPANLKIALIGKCKYIRQQSLIKLIKKYNITQKEAFEKLPEVAEYLRTGKKGIRMIMPLATHWNAYTEFISTLPLCDQRILKNIPSPLALYIENPLLIHMHINTFKVKNAHQKKWDRIKAFYKLWTPEEEKTFLASGDESIVKKIERREEMIFDVLFEHVKMSYNQLVQHAKHVFIDDTLSFEDVIAKCKEVEFLCKHTYYVYYKKRNYDDEGAKLKALNHYLTTGNRSLIPKGLAVFIDRGP